jgi:hypothetical protein
MLAPLFSLGRLILATLRDVAPIVLVIAFFQIVVLGQPLPNLERIVAGLVLVMIGLALFVQGLEMGSLFWLLAFAFGLGFGTTVAEPALIAVAAEAARAAAETGELAADEAARQGYARDLRYTVAGAVGIALMIGVVRIVKGWPIQYFVIAGYFLVVVLTAFAPDEIVAVAYDSGGVTTSTVTVPLVTALGVGLATVIRGRNPLVDGFGLIAFASLTPIMFVLIFGMMR